MAIQFTITGSRLLIEDCINAVVSFFLIGVAIYCFVVMPISKLLARIRRGEASTVPATKTCPECLGDVPIAARRRAFCTSVLAANRSIIAAEQRPLRARP